jgi:hypothetical protein
MSATGPQGDTSAFIRGADRRGADILPIADERQLLTQSGRFFLEAWCLSARKLGTMATLMGLIQI